MLYFKDITINITNLLINKNINLPKLCQLQLPNLNTTTFHQ